MRPKCAYPFFCYLWFKWNDGNSIRSVNHTWSLFEKSVSRVRFRRALFSVARTKRGPILTFFSERVFSYCATGWVFSSAFRGSFSYTAFFALNYTYSASKNAVWIILIGSVKGDGEKNRFFYLYTPHFPATSCSGVTDRNAFTVLLTGAISRTISPESSD